MTSRLAVAQGVADSWFARPAVEVARDLLGARLRTDRPGGVVVLRVTEVEAYTGIDDPASHAYRGPSARHASMYLPGGHLYVYRHLGLHHCINVVTGAPGAPAAVLLRAGEVVEGAELARERRSAAGVVRRDVDLARGPARLAVALGLDAEDDGLPIAARFEDGRARAVPAGAERAALAEQGGREVPARSAAIDDLVLTVPPVRLRAVCGPRVGVSSEARDGERFAWRFWLPDEATVSTDRGPARPRRSGQREAVTSRSRRTAH